MNPAIITKLQRQVDDFYNDTGYQKINLKVKDYMYPNPLVLNTDARLKDAISLIIRNGIDAVPIVDEHDKVIGIITKTHALREIYSSGDVEKSVKDVMRKNPATTTPDEDSLNLLKIPIGSIPVVENGQLTGIVNLSDTIRACFSSILLLQEELKTIFNSAYSGIITIDNNNCIRFINPAAEKILNVTNTDLSGKPIADFFPDLKMQEVMSSGATIFGKKIFFRNRIIIANVSQLRNKDEIIGAVAVFQDISDLENISEELKYTKELKNEVDAIIESSFDGIYLTNTFGKILRVNNAFTRITGISSEELIYKTIAELVDIGIFLQPLPLDDILKGKSVTTFQEVRTGKSILVTSSPIFDNKKNVIRIVHNVRDITELNNLKDQLEKAESLSQHYRDQLEIIKLPSKYVAKSNKSKTLIELVMRLSKIDATVLLLGESGVGKDVIAEMLHENSPRKDKLLITVNCAAIPDNLLESELFGYEPGAFTGANKKGKIGAFELADGSTLFLDEIGEMPLNLQSKILRVLQKKEITKLGSQTTTKLDVRIIAATNRDLEAMVAANTFRGDLYYRLSVVPVIVPPLRERKEEIPDLVFHFVQMFNNKYGFNKHFDDRVIYEFLDYDWPGNIRELENVIERCMITCPDNIIRNADFLCREAKSADNGSERPALPPDFNYKYALENYEKEIIANALAQFGTTRKAAAELGISQPTIVRKAARYNIKVRQ